MGRLSKAATAASANMCASLIRADEKRKAEEELEAKLLEGLNSPESELTPADWSALRKEASARLGARKKRR